MAGPLIADDLTHLALCWRLVRRDGVALGFTSHDRDLLVDGLVHLSRPGMSPSAIVLGDGVTADDLEVAGGLSAAALTRADLLAGRWDGARLRLFLVDWRDPALGQVALAAGTLGDVALGEAGDAGFVATLESPAAALRASAVEICSPECRAELGDARCRVSLRGRSRIAAISAADAGRFQVSGLNPADHAECRMLVLDGAAAGLERRLIAAVEGWLHMDEPAALAVGDRVLLTEGCDKRFATCRDRFGNAANFRGEPHVPGGDMLQRIGA